MRISDMRLDIITAFLSFYCVVRSLMPHLAPPCCVREGTVPVRLPCQRDMIISFLAFDTMSLPLPPIFTR